MARGEFVHVDSLDSDTRALVEAAQAVASNAYAPFSKFSVGAALRCVSGAVFRGCNVENSTYGATICAERSAVLAAVADGERTFSDIAIWTATDKPEVPCGLCCQVMAEFAPSLQLWIACRGADVRKVRLDEIYPEPFRLEP